MSHELIDHNRLKTQRRLKNEVVCYAAAHDSGAATMARVAAFHWLPVGCRTARYQKQCAARSSCLAKK
jgi:hypothetical protein